MQPGLFAGQEAQHPDTGYRLAQNGGQGRTSHTHVQREDEHGIQYQVQHSPNQGRHHARLRIALRVDEAVEPCGEHGEGSPQQVDAQICVRIHIGGIAGPEQIEHRPTQQVAEKEYRHRAAQQQRAGISQYPFRPLLLARPPGYGEQRRPSRAEEISERRDQRGQRERQPDACQRHAVRPRQMPDIDTVHHIV